jgi:hypothetical protein
LKGNWKMKQFALYVAIAWFVTVLMGIGSIALVTSIVMAIVHSFR